MFQPEQIVESPAAQEAAEKFNPGEVIIEHVSNSGLDHPLIKLPTILGIDFSVTKHVLMLWVVAAFVFVVVTLAVRRFLKQPRRATVRVMLKTYQGSCHCGAVRFEADIDLAQGTGKCNCSICTKTRNWAALIKPEAFRLLSGADALSDYRFASKQGQHLFCKHCGVRVYGTGDHPKVGGRMYAVAIATLDDVDADELAAAPVKYIDGRNDRFDQAPTDTRLM